jgi:hypothetical protein
MPNILLPPLLAKPEHKGFLALLEVLRRARISGIRRAKIYGTDSWKCGYPGLGIDPKVRSHCLRV